MKATLLQALKNLPTINAEELIKQAGHTPHILPEGHEVMMMMVMSNTIICRQKDGVVISADPGDPGEVEND